MVNPYNIPTEMQMLKQWCLWRMIQRVDPETKEVKNAKLPVRPTGQALDTTDPEHWVTYDEALKAFQEDKYDRFYGLGFVFTESSGIVGVDLDKVRDPRTRTTEPWARDIITALSSYTELSQSKTGWHVIVKGKLPAGGNRKGRFEVYSRERYFCMTGLRASNSPATIEERSDVLADLVARIDTLDPNPPSASGIGKKKTVDESVEDFKLILLTMRQVRGNDMTDEEFIQRILDKIESQHHDRYEARNDKKGWRRDKSMSWFEYEVRRAVKKRIDLGLRIKDSAASSQVIGCQMKPPTRLHDPLLRK